MRKIYSVIVMMFVAVTVCAQEAQEKKNEKPERVYYLQLTGGVNSSYSEGTRFLNLGEKINFGGKISMGLEFNPYWTTFFQLAYNRNAVVHVAHSDYLKREFDAFDFFINAAYNLSNGIGGYKGVRKHIFHVYAGVGMAYSYGKVPFTLDNFNNITPGIDLGLNYSYALNHRFSIITDVGLYAFSDKYNGIKHEMPLDLRVNAEIGVRFYLNKKGTKKWVREPETQYVERLVKEVDTVRVTEYVVKEVEKDIHNKIETIFFTINSYEILEEEISKVKAVADYMNAHPEKTVLIIGSADRQTGNERINSELRANRARVVADMLVEKFGIEKARVKTLMGKGEKEDLYQKQYEKNRAAVCIIADFGLE